MKPELIARTFFCIGWICKNCNGYNVPTQLDDIEHGGENCGSCGAYHSLLMPEPFTYPIKCESRET